MVGPAAEGEGPCWFVALEMRWLVTQFAEFEIEFFGLWRIRMTATKRKQCPEGPGASCLNLQMIPIDDSMAECSANPTAVEAGTSYRIDKWLRGLVDIYLNDKGKQFT